MSDTRLDKTLVVLIGIPGLTICVLVWVQPMDITERILAVAIGMAGFTWALICGLSLRTKLAKQKGSVKSLVAESTHKP